MGSELFNAARRSRQRPHFAAERFAAHAGTVSTTRHNTRAALDTSASSVAATINIDASGNESSGEQNVQTFAYDSRGNVRTIVEGYSTSEGGPVTALRTTSHAYDAASRLIRTTYDSMTVIADDMVTRADIDALRKEIAGDRSLAERTWHAVSRLESFFIERGIHGDKK